MILSCPSCAARFVVKPDTISPDGRRVRCGRCKHEWLAVAVPDQAAPPQPEEPAPIMAMAEEPVFTPEPPPFPPLAPPPPLPPPRSGMWVMAIGWAALVLVVGALGIGMFARDQIIAAWPPAAQVYAAIGFAPPSATQGLRLVDLNRSWANRDGATVLIVEGMIVNEGGAAKPVPSLRGVLSDAQNREVQAWEFSAERASLAPGESVKFRTELRDPAAAATGLAISFVAGS